MDIFGSEIVTTSIEPTGFIPVDGRLTVDTFNTLTYGNKYNGNTDTDGIISLTFEATGGKLQLNVDGYDIDRTARSPFS